MGLQKVSVFTMWVKHSSFTVATAANETAFLQSAKCSKGEVKGTEEVFTSLLCENAKRGKL